MVTSEHVKSNAKPTDDPQRVIVATLRLPIETKVLCDILIELEEAYGPNCSVRQEGDYVVVEVER